jgi:threonine/homoserine/homoserine lactone efflux protein
MEEQRRRLAGGDGSRPVHAPGLLGKVVTIAAGVVLLLAVFMFSLLVFAIVVTGGLLVLGYLWWKTRDLRKQIREQMGERPTGERVIEGEVIREDSRDDADQR